MKLKRRLASYLLKEQVDEFRQATEMLLELWERRPWLATANAPLGKGRLANAIQESAQLGEIDQHLADNLTRHMRYVRLTTEGFGIADESERLDAVTESRVLYLKDVMSQHLIALWADFGFGQTIEVIPEDEPAQEVWSEFWTARRNRPVLKGRKLYKLSDKTLTDGEVFYAFFTNEGEAEAGLPSGGSTIRTIRTEQIVEIITDPQDEDVPLWYKREYSPDDSAKMRVIYYPDWEATEEDLAKVTLDASSEDVFLAPDVDGAGDVVMMHAMFREIDGRGWPLLTAGGPWIRAYRDFCQDRAAVAASVAMYVRKLKVEGGSRAVDAMRAKIESTLTQLNQYGEENPPATAGSTWLENQAANLQPLPMKTGAGDAAVDGQALVQQAALGGRVFPHWVGRGEAFRLATASSMAQPVLKAFRRYQMFWSDVWRDMVELVLRQWEKTNGMEFASYEADVSTDAQVDQDVSVTTKALVEMYDRGLVPEEIALWLSLTLLGVPNVADVMKKEKEKREELEKAAVAAAARVVAPPEEPEPDESDNGTEPEDTVSPAEVRAVVEAAERAILTGDWEA